MDSKVSVNIIKHWQALCSDIVFGDIAALLIQNKVITVNDYEEIKSHPEKSQMEILLVVLLKQSENTLLKFVALLERDYSWLAERIREGVSADQGNDETDAVPISPRETVEKLDETSAEEDGDCNRLNSLNRTNCFNSKITLKGNKLQKKKTVKTKVKNKFKAKIANLEAVISSSTDLITKQKNEEITDEIITILRKSSHLSRNWTLIAHSLGLTDRVQDIRFRVLMYNEHLSMCMVYLMKDWLEMFPESATLSRLIQVLRSEKFNKVADELTQKLYAESVKENEKFH